MSYNDAGVQQTTSWTDHNGTLQTFPIINDENMTTFEANYHFGSNGALKIAKAMWWMLARMAGWDGSITTGINDHVKDKSLSPIIEIRGDDLRITIDDFYLFATINLYNLQGKLVASQKADSNTCIINISAFQTGIYLVTLSNSKSIHTQKVVIR